MSLNYGTLKSQLIEDTHRNDLSSKADDFIRQAEGIIYRRLRASEMITRVDLTDADRVTADEGFYSLPSDFLEVRSLFLISSSYGDVKLEQVSLGELRKFAASSSVRQFALISDGEVEFRGVPSSSDEMELIYYARPAALTDDADTNDILTRHEAIYLHAAMSVLYQYTQDLELSAAHGQIAVDAIEALNEQAARMIGGASSSGYYDFSSWGAR